MPSEKERGVLADGGRLRNRPIIGLDQIIAP
jgi:hypothetical protein